MSKSWDAVIVGSGPNGLAAAIELARHGFEVCVLEARETIGGGMRTVESTLPGFLHDECSAIHPLGVLSPYFSRLPLAEHGLTWLPFPISVAHPFDDRPAAILSRSWDETAERLGVDGKRWVRVFRPFVHHSSELISDLLGPPTLRPQRPFQFAKFGFRATWPATWLARRLFREPMARGLFAGCAGHAVLPLEKFFTGALGMIFSISAHVKDWPCVRGGTASLALALQAYLETLGGKVEVSRPVGSLADIPPSKVVLFDVSPRSVAQIAGNELSSSYVRRLGRYRYGPGTFKIDWALDGPIPWRDPVVAKASTVHVGGTLEEIADSERAAWKGRVHSKPYLILCQQSAMDPSRAPEGKHTGYAYCHVPSHCETDQTDAIESQVERFAPGFRDRILARHPTSPKDFEALNANYVGGAVTGGVADWRQLFTRPVARINPYTTPNPRFFICSASTPPGGGVHGMCGYHAAQAAIRRLRQRT